MCYIGGAVSGDGYFAAGIHACVGLAIANGSQGENGMTKLNLTYTRELRTYKCSYCNGTSFMSCTVDGKAACVECFKMVCRNIEEAKGLPRESRR